MKKRRHLRSRHLNKIPVIDLFAGPGGLGEGFAADTDAGGTGRFRIVLSIEKDPIAHQTLELRAFVRQFERAAVPAAYYALARGELSRDSLFRSCGAEQQAAAAQSEAWRAELGVEPDVNVLSRVRAAIGSAETSVLIGGPPCQAYSLAGRSRNGGNPSYDPAADGRHTLYREYLKVLAHQWPAVFVMENVKGILSATWEGQRIFDRILDDLREPGKALRRFSKAAAGQKYRVLPISAYRGNLFDGLRVESDDPRDFVVRCEAHGIPQARHRVILLGVREDIALPPDRPVLVQYPSCSVNDAIADLPPLRSGLSAECDSTSAWMSVQLGFLREPWFRRLETRRPAVAQAIERAVAAKGRDRLTRGAEFVNQAAAPRICADWYSDERLGGVCNHHTRAHMRSDIRRYLFVSAFGRVEGRTPSLAEMPTEMLPDHRNVKRALEGGLFSDRFRVQVGNRPSTTITSHISKDGHYYIHPDTYQCRSLTVREAARLQTFPDNYVFTGPRTAQYHQVGNAVPPLLARQIAAMVADVLS